MNPDPFAMGGQRMNPDPFAMAPGHAFRDHAKAVLWARRWSKVWQVRYRVHRVPILRAWHVCPTADPAPSNR